MTNNIDTVIERVLIREGRFVIDHAGPTNFGITIPAYEEFLGKNVNEETIRNMTRQEAKLFYNWLLKKQKVSGIINIEVMDLLFDSMVNHGNETAIKWAQKSCKVKEDGILGPITISAINNNQKTVYYGVLVERLKLYVHLSVSNPNKYLKYLRGWTNKRVCNFIKEI